MHMNKISPKRLHTAPPPHRRPRWWPWLAAAPLTACLTAVCASAAATGSTAASAAASASAASASAAAAPLNCAPPGVKQPPCYSPRVYEAAYGVALRCGAGGSHSRCSSRRTVEAPTRMPSPSSSPWIHL
jgi:hypothetical protein